MAFKLNRCVTVFWTRTSKRIGSGLRVSNVRDGGDGEQYRKGSALTRKTAKSTKI